MKPRYCRAQRSVMKPCRRARSSCHTGLEKCGFSVKRNSMFRGFPFASSRRKEPNSLPLYSTSPVLAEANDASEWRWNSVGGGVQLARSSGLARKTKEKSLSLEGTCRSYMKLPVCAMKASSAPWGQAASSRPAHAGPSASRLRRSGGGVGAASAPHCEANARKSSRRTPSTQACTARAGSSAVACGKPLAASMMSDAKADHSPLWSSEFSTNSAKRADRASQSPPPTARRSSAAAATAAGVPSRSAATPSSTDSISACRSPCFFVLLDSLAKRITAPEHALR
mmetsp:Transcript_66036/g.196477  ORF Transcript_66036/g.196477 Transcript_66036/m.196477 type:complete len:283 (-) Transcript_66036:536-1384(-)